MASKSLSTLSKGFLFSVCLYSSLLYPSQTTQAPSIPGETTRPPLLAGAGDEASKNRAAALAALEQQGLNPAALSSLLFHEGAFLTNLNSAINNSNSFALKSRFDNKPLVEGLKLGLKAGLLGGVEGGVSTAVSQIIVASLTHTLPATKGTLSYACTLCEKITYGTVPLTYADLALLNNIVYNLVSPYLQTSATDYAKERRAAVIEEEFSHQEKTEGDTNWPVLRGSLIRLLEFNCYQLNKYIGCYDLSRMQDQFFLKRWLAGVISFFSVRQNERVAFELNEARNSLKHVVGLVSSVKSGRELTQERENLKSHLTICCHLLEHIALIAEPEGASGAKGGPAPQKFLKPTGQAAGGLGDLSALLGSGTGA